MINSALFPSVLNKRQTKVIPDFDSESLYNNLRQHFNITNVLILLTDIIIIKQELLFKF
jgi:hypothetical protein